MFDVSFEGDPQVFSDKDRVHFGVTFNSDKVTYEVRNYLNTAGDTELFVSFEVALGRFKTICEVLNDTYDADSIESLIEVILHFRSFGLSESLKNEISRHVTLRNK